MDIVPPQAGSRTRICKTKTVTDVDGENPAMIDPSPELQDDIPITNIELPPKVKEALTAAGLRTVGEVREAPDVRILRIPDLGESALALLRANLGLPSSLGVRSEAAPILPRNDHRDD